MDGFDLFLQDLRQTIWQISSDRERRRVVVAINNLSDRYGLRFFYESLGHHDILVVRDRRKCPRKKE